ncbi:hypothetical protein [Pedobacter cryoconitis]|uniref:PepSY-like beta-lactamase-inhibitor n=1 Tax=Pedobacter cryoconitis TaxID=188932 RepID=A0A327SY38_9SPHI|nr:hypothetical protein [Pedobacter cryoconitis]RAJ33342.1 hypothetical protein LY11_01384 [Pedobacter cryoconitis]
MRSFILSAAVLAIAGVSTVKANEIKNPIAIQSDSAAYSVKLDSTANTFRTDSAAYTVAADSAINTAKTDSAAFTARLDSTSNIVKQDSAAKVPVKVEALPDPVKATLKADAYKEWTPTTAFLITNADKSTYYQVDVKKDDKVAFLKVGADGVVQQ